MKVFEGFQKGVNLGGWISQFAEYDPKHFETFITEEDIKEIADMGLDHVRVPVDYNVLEDEDGNVIESGFSYIADCVLWCRKYGIHMLIDLHECYGYSFDPLKKDMDRERFFHDDGLQQRFIELWIKIARRFGKDTDVVAFELLNEVVLPTVIDEWNDLAARTVKAIRQEASDIYIVFGGVQYSNVTSVAKLKKPDDDKIVFNFHCYEPMVFTHQKAYWVEGMTPDFDMHYPGTIEEYQRESKAFSNDLVAAIYKSQADIGPEFFDGLFKEAVEAAERADVPLYCGEYGVIEFAPMDDALAWFKDINSIFEKYRIGRAVWNYKEKEFGLMGKEYAAIRDELIQYL
ncbi:MAG: glycoside hydrolase family 5 protein [Lachnospiraceae bacterium]|nr:glycoside hydrolase family 5 protein [Lachnospiraceae bacterium]MDE6625083.1 glycoside hydrolase family 5 protein [Lachnospiraceae bacterium]